MWRHTWRMQLNLWQCSLMCNYFDHLFNKCSAVSFLQCLVELHTDYFQCLVDAVCSLEYVREKKKVSNWELMCDCIALSWRWNVNNDSDDAASSVDVINWCSLYVGIPAEDCRAAVTQCCQTDKCCWYWCCCWLKAAASCWRQVDNRGLMSLSHVQGGPTSEATAFDCSYLQHA